MKPAQLPRFLIIFIIALLVVTFLTGNVRAFTLTQVSPSAAATIIANSQTETVSDLTPTSTPAPILASADTAGIIALAIVIVIVVLVGAIWGERSVLQKKTTPK